MPPGGGSPASLMGRSIPTGISGPEPTSTARVLWRVASGSPSTTAPMPRLRMEPPLVGTRNPAPDVKSASGSQTSAQSSLPILPLSLASLKISQRSNYDLQDHHPL